MSGLDERGLPRGTRLRDGLEVSPVELRELVSRGAAWLLDCREAYEFEAARIEGSHLIPLGEIEDRIDEVREAEGEIVTICHHGVRSLKAALVLRAHGVAARSLAGGVDLWSVAIDPAVPRYEKDGASARVIGTRSV